STSPRPRPTYKWWVVFMLWFVCFFNYADRQSIAAVFPELEREFHFRDRKSTRLNSSHVEISYAVFCLKKKKEKNQETLVRRRDAHRSFDCAPCGLGGAISGHQGEGLAGPLARQPRMHMNCNRGGTVVG